MLRPDDKLGPYTLIRRLGVGSYGEVWLGEKRSTLAVTRFALKIPLDPDTDTEAIRREALVWLRASGHPNVLPIIEADIYDGSMVIVSEYVTGGSLADTLRHYGGRAPDLSSAVRWMLGILDGLRHLHELPEPLIHRDLKPANILMQGGVPRITDFGLARVLQANTSQSMTVSGTLQYMSPEAFQARRTVHSDIWAAGVIFYQMLSGALPFPDGDMPTLIHAILNLAPEPLPQIIPAELRRIVDGILQRDARHRFSSARQALEALSAAAHAGSPLARPSLQEDPTQLTPARRFDPSTLPEAAPPFPGTLEERTLAQAGSAGIPRTQDVHPATVSAPSPSPDQTLVVPATWASDSPRVRGGTGLPGSAAGGTTILPPPSLSEALGPATRAESTVVLPAGSLAVSPAAHENDAGWMDLALPSSVEAIPEKRPLSSRPARGASRKWLWSGLALAILLGVVALAWRFLPHSAHFPVTDTVQTKAGSPAATAGKIDSGSIASVLSSPGGTTASGPGGGVVNSSSPPAGTPGRTVGAGTSVVLADPKNTSGQTLPIPVPVPVAMKTGDLIITGAVDDFDAIESLRAALRGTAGCTGARIAEYTSVRQGEATRFSFEIQCTLYCVENEWDSAVARVGAIARQRAGGVSVRAER